MSKTFEQGRDEVAKLCEYFAKNQATFSAPGRKEAHVRQDLIDPLFRALGWDVGNAAQVAPQYAEVVVEDSLDDQGQNKAPDYAFRVGTLPKFFVEAKKCGVNIATDPAPAYQLRRYGWSAKVAVSILTNFEELAVYDCTKRPVPSEKATRSRIFDFRYDQYVDRWRELWDIFSREAVWTGGFDQYAASKRKRGTSEVDSEFLKEIEGWRDALARNVALRNRPISSEDLNRAVQLTIDRVVFLRMAEDRGLERERQLLKLSESPDCYARFMRDLCRKADDKYNSGLFHFHKEAGVSDAPDTVTPRLTVDDNVFKPILQRLYFEHGSPYHFGVLPVEILGTVYERFLGKVIRLTPGGQAKVEEKPEVRKAGGVYYTPAYIVNYIVRQTVGRQVEGKSPAQLAGRGKAQPLRVLDMACGSGSFLLGAYQFLLDHYLNWYIDHSPKNRAKAVDVTRAGEWRLTIAEKKRILTTHIYGVDIDPQAVEVTKLSLLLKVLEGENDATLSAQLKLFEKERALPNLSDNIKCGNSLIGPDFLGGRQKTDFDEEDLLKVNPFDWQTEFPAIMKSGGFDTIIGNPPYVRMEAFKEIKQYLREHYTSHAERTDLYVYFIEKEHDLLRDGGCFGMIVSNKFLRAKYGESLRSRINAVATVTRIVDLAGLPVFIGATVRTLILITRRSTSNGRRWVTYSPPPGRDELARVQSGVCGLADVCDPLAYKIRIGELSATGWRLIRPEYAQLMDRLSRGAVPLRTYTDGKICRGIVSGLTEAFVINAETRDRIVSSNRKAAEIIRPFLQGRQIRRYDMEPVVEFLIYTHHGVDMKPYPAVIEHLRPFRRQLQRRATNQQWYELQQPQFAYVRHLEQPKIVFPDIATGCRFAIDNDGRFGANTVYFIATADPALLGVLNSRLAFFVFQQTCAALEGPGESYLRFFGQYLEDFPVRLPVPGDARRNRLAALAETMQTRRERLPSIRTTQARAALQRHITATDAAIDSLVYELYGLTDKEIAVVELATAAAARRLRTHS